MSNRPNLDTLLSNNFNDPFMSHQYVIDSISIPNSPSGDFTVVDLSRLFPPRFFQERVESLDIPFQNFEVESRHIMTSKKYYAGYNSFNGFNANFFEDNAANSIKGFVLWQDQIKDSNNNYFPAGKYQATMKVKLLNTNDIEIARATFTGVFPTQVTPLTLTGSEITRVVVQVAFSVNKVVWSW